MLQIVDPQLLAWQTPLSTHVHTFFVRRGPPEIIEITARDHCPTARRYSPLLTALAVPQLRSSARIPALTPARLPLVLVGSRRLSLSLTGALMHVRLALSRLSPALSPSRPRRISPSLSLPLAPSCVSGLPCRPSAAVLSAHAGQCGSRALQWLGDMRSQSTRGATWQRSSSARRIGICCCGAYPGL